MVMVLIRQLSVNPIIIIFRAIASLQFAKLILLLFIKEWVQLLQVFHKKGIWDWLPNQI